MGARWYSAADAVFRSRDSVSGELVTPVSLNRYTYGWANPLRYWDPDGHSVLQGDGGPGTTEYYGVNNSTDWARVEEIHQAEEDEESSGWFGGLSVVVETASSREFRDLVAHEMWVDGLTEFMGVYWRVPEDWGERSDWEKWQTFTWAASKAVSATTLERHEWVQLSYEELNAFWVENGEDVIDRVTHGGCGRPPENQNLFMSGVHWASGQVCRHRAGIGQIAGATLVALAVAFEMAPYVAPFLPAAASSTTAATNYTTSTSTSGGAYATQLGAPELTATGTALTNWATSGVGQTMTVIGKVGDLKAPGAIQSGETTLLDRLPDQGSFRLNWEQNSSALRSEMSRGVPIRDATVNRLTGELANNTGFLRAERNLLESHGWTYDPKTTLWSPPG